MSATVISDAAIEAAVYVYAMKALCRHAGCPDDAAALIAQGAPLNETMIGTNHSNTGRFLDGSAASRTTKSIPPGPGSNHAGQGTRGRTSLNQEG